MFPKILDYARLIFLFIVILYTIIAAYYFFHLPIGFGDESLFISDLEFIKSKGWIEAIKKNVSIPYMLLAYPFSFLFENYISLRLVNVLLLLCLLGYFFYSRNNKRQSFYGYVFFYISSISFFYLGINDILFAVSLIIFINEGYLLIREKEGNVHIAFIFLLIAIFTRELFIVYLPLIFLLIYVLFMQGKVKISIMATIGITLVSLLLLNTPSIIENGTLSYDRKSPPPESDVTWAQRQYLAQVMVNNGDLSNGQHPSWEQTQEFIKTNGKESLPDGILGGLTHDFKLTVGEFFKDFLYSVYFGTRQLGLILLVTLGFVFFRIFKSGKIEWENLIPILTLLMLSVFSLIIISYVELRWLIPVFFMSIVYYDDLVNEIKIPAYLVLVNYLIITLFSSYGIMTILNLMAV